jgi:integral membrane protein 2B
MEDDVIKYFLKQIMSQFNREREDPFKENRDLESKLGDNTFQDRFFREEIAMKDDEDDSFTDINIPDFRDGRQGRFIHDFKNNQTTIVDVEAKRCFVYPLDNSVTLPPKSMIDAILKMQTGYYFPDTNVLRKKMRVVTPELDKDDEYISERTQYVCDGMRIYKLEPFVSGVFKRSISVSDDHAKFAEFSGRKIVEFDFVNFDELLRYEEKLKN